MARKLEVALCTWNRAEQLRSTLRSLQRAQVPKGWVLRCLVIDNGSTDETQHVLDELRRDGLPLQAIQETQAGHTHARNCAIENSEGELVVWTDDDVIVPDEWLVRYAMAFDQNADEAFWGAAIEPVFPEGIPKWIEENWSAISGCFAARDLGSQALAFGPDRLPYGANFAVRGDVMRANRFDTRLGRRRQEVVGEDEIEYLRRLLAAGHRGSWIPGNAVQHVIVRERASERYVWQYFIGQGKRLRWQGQDTTPRASLRRHLRRARTRYFLTRWWAATPVWFAHLANWGLARGKWLASRSPSATALKTTSVNSSL